MKTALGLRAATEPIEARGLDRGQVKLMVSGPGPRQHLRFHQLDEVLHAGDLLVVNDSATLAAALPVRTLDEERLWLHLSTRLGPGHWIAELRDQGHGKRTGEVGELVLPDGSRLRPGAPYLGSPRLFHCRSEFGPDYLRRWGQPIRYPYLRGRFPLSAYQTVFAVSGAGEGSAEMPSAGRAFDRELLGRLQQRGVGVAAITLHTGVGSLEQDERPYPEFYRVPADTAARLQRARRVIAVGTSVVRALESSGGGAAQGWTDLVIERPQQLRVVDDLISGFHPPDASHLKMLGALAGRSRLQADYESAARHGYLSHEFGDLHLLRTGGGRRSLK